MSALLLDEHDVVLLDLDGTVYRGGELVAGAEQAIGGVHERGVRVRYVTNNASKLAQAVADHLTGLGLPAESVEVSTSAQAGAAMLAERLRPGSRVLVVGSDALASELERIGLVPVRNHADRPDAVVQGHSPDTGWGNLAEACLSIRDGVVWVACNGDVTLPTERGELPGNGAMVAALRAATGREPHIAGKPERPLLDAAVASSGGTRPLMIGDRLDTDIAGAVNAGMPGLMVLTGVNAPADLLAAPPALRPDYVAADLRAVHQPAVESVIGEQELWQAKIDDGVLKLAVSGAGPDDDSLSALRELCSVWWAAGSGPVRVRAEDPKSERVLRQLGLR